MAASALCCTPPEALAAPSPFETRLAVTSLPKPRLPQLALLSAVPCSFSSGRIQTSELPCQTARLPPHQAINLSTTTSLTTLLSRPSRATVKICCLCQRACLEFCLVFVSPACDHPSQHSLTLHHLDPASSWSTLYLRTASSATACQLSSPSTVIRNSSARSSGLIRSWPCSGAPWESF